MSGAGPGPVAPTRARPCEAGPPTGTSAAGAVDDRAEVVVQEALGRLLDHRVAGAGGPAVRPLDVGVGDVPAADRRGGVPARAVEVRGALAAHAAEPLVPAGVPRAAHP